MKAYHRVSCILLTLGLASSVTGQEKDLFRDRVLPPWTPVRVEGGDVHVWNRVFRFEKGPMPVSITSAGEELLAGPILLAVSADSKTVEWNKGAGETKDAVRTVTKCEGRAGRLKVEALTTIEFDGMIRIDLSLKPEPESSVERVELRIPCRAEYASLFTHNVIGMEAVASPRWNLRNSPERQWWGGAVPGNGWKSQFTPQVWMGTEQRGLAWFSDTPANCNPRDADNAVEIVRNERATDLVIRFIQAPIAVKAPLDFTFGLMATPVKPFVEEYRDLRIASSAGGTPEDFEERFMKPGVWAADEVLSELRGGVTAAAWVCLSEVRAMHNVMGSRAIDLMYDGPEKELAFSLIDSEGAMHSVSCPFELVLGQWYHLAGTYDGQEIVLWVDGKEAARKEERFEFRSTGQIPFAIGANGWGSRRWPGKLDEVGVFRRTLTAVEIDELMKGTKPNDGERSVAAFWDFEQKPEGVMCTGIGPDHVALIFRPPRDVENYSPKWTDGKQGRAIELVGDYAQATGNREGLTGFEYLARKGIDILVLWNNWSDIWGYPGITDPKYKDFLHRFLAEAHKHGIRVLPYISIGIMMENEPDAREMIGKVAQGRSAAFGRGNVRGYHIEKNLAWAEYYPEKLAQFAREFDIDGIYMDGGGLEATEDMPEADATADRKEVVRYSVFTGRELMRRCYAIFHGGVRESGFVLTHDSAPPVVSQDCFTDVLLNGELHYWLLMFRRLTRADGSPLLSRFPPELTRAWFAGEVYGVPIVFCGKERNKRYTDGKRKLLRGAILTDDEISSVLAVHGVPVWSNSPLQAWSGLAAFWWQARDRFGRDGTTWHPYWQNDQFLHVEPYSVKASFFRRAEDGGMLLVVANLADSDKEAKVVLSAEALGSGRWVCTHVIPRWQDFRLEENCLTCPLQGGTAAYFHLVPSAK